MTCTTWVQCHVWAPKPDTITHAMFYLETGTQHNFHQSLYPTTDGKRYRDLQSSIRQSLENPVDEEDKGLKEIENSRTPQEKYKIN